MRVIVFFDLPVVTIADRRAYTAFRKFLIASGFIMMQESVYSKIVQNLTVANAVISNIRKASPKDGIIQVLTITEKQYAGIEMIIGKKQSEVVDTDERLVIL